MNRQIFEAWFCQRRGSKPIVPTTNEDRQTFGLMRPQVLSGLFPLLVGSHPVVSKQVRVTLCSIEL